MKKKEVKREGGRRTGATGKCIAIQVGINRFCVKSVEKPCQAISDVNPVLDDHNL